MRVDATIVFDIKDGGEISVPIRDATPVTIQDVLAVAFRNGWWSGPSSSGTHYPARRLDSAAVVYRAHCGNDECAMPYGKPVELYADVELRDHVHELPEPEPEPEPGPEPEPARVSTSTSPKKGGSSKKPRR